MIDKDYREWFEKIVCTEVLIMIISIVLYLCSIALYEYLTGKELNKPYPNILVVFWMVTIFITFCVFGLLTIWN